MNRAYQIENVYTTGCATSICINATFSGYICAALRIKWSGFYEAMTIRMRVLIKFSLTKGCTLTGTPGKSLSLTRASFGGILSAVGIKYMGELGTG